MSTYVTLISCKNNMVFGELPDPTSNYTQKIRVTQRTTHVPQTI